MFSFLKSCPMNRLMPGLPSRPGLGVLATLLLVLASTGYRVAAADRPNIVFIMSDDHAAHAISAYSGGRLNQTPHLDRLAREGIRFDRAFAANSICTPSRATLLTGKYSHKNGVPVFNAFDGSQPHVAKMLQSAGYHTLMVGKWHLGSDPTGFDYWEILPGQGRYLNPVLYDRDGAKTYSGYVTDILTDLALAALERRPADKPFFLMLHHKAPHREWTPKGEYRDEFSRRVIPEPATLRDDYAGRSDALREQKQSVFKDLTRNDLKLIPPANLTAAEKNQWLGVKPTSVEIEEKGKKRVLTGEELDRWKYQRYLQDYLGCIQSVDDNVGRVLDWLEANHLSKNTLVIYTSDQGFFLGEHGMYDKRFMYEESIRMPLLVRWPGQIQSRRSTSRLIVNTDFAPTFLELAGVPIPSDIQGRSLVPILKDEPTPGWRKSFYYRYYHDPGHHDTRAHLGVRTERYKLIHFWKKDQWECYDLAKDPNELRNIYSDPKSQTIVAELKTELARLKAELEDHDEFANELPPDGVDGAPKKWKPGYKPLLP